VKTCLGKAEGEDEIADEVSLDWPVGGGSELGAFWHRGSVGGSGPGMAGIENSAQRIRKEENYTPNVSTATGNRQGRNECVYPSA